MNHCNYREIECTTWVRKLKIHRIAQYVHQIVNQKAMKIQNKYKHDAYQCFQRLRCDSKFFYEKLSN